MTRKRAILTAVAALLVLLLAAFAFLASRLRPEQLADTFEQRLSSLLGMTVEVRGNAQIKVLPRPGVAFAEVVVSDGKDPVLTAQKVTARLQLIPLLSGQFKLATLTLEQPELTLQRGAEGLFMPSDRKKPEQTQARRLANRVSVDKGTLRFTDAAGKTQGTVTGLDLVLRDLRFEESGELAFTADLAAEALRWGRLEMRDLRGMVTGKDGAWRAEPLRFELFGSECRGHLVVDLRGARPAFQAELATDDLSLGELFRGLAGRPLFEGTVAGELSLAAEGGGRFLETLDGTLELAGSDLVQHGFDLDRVIEDLRQARNVGLVDVGAYLFAGPLGAVLTQGYDVAGLYRGLKQDRSQKIEELVFHWRIEDGVARAEDVAIRTRGNRIAVKGAVDLAAGRYAGITLAVLDRQGCAELTEEITGPLENPTVKPVSILQSLSGPLTGILRQAWEIVDPTECRPFYQGRVEPP